MKKEYNIKLLGHISQKNKIPALIKRAYVCLRNHFCQKKKTNKNAVQFPKRTQYMYIS